MFYNIIQVLYTKFNHFSLSFNHVQKVLTKKAIKIVRNYLESHLDTSCLTDKLVLLITLN